METEPRFIVPSDGLEKPGIEPATPGLHGEWHNHCTTEASVIQGEKAIVAETHFGQLLFSSMGLASDKR